MKNILKVIGQKTHLQRYKNLFDSRKPDLIVNSYAPGSRPGSAFPIRIWIRIQDSQINADPDPQHLHWLVQ